MHLPVTSGLVTPDVILLSVGMAYSISLITNMMELGGAEIAGIKMHAAIDVIMRRNHIHHCTMGIWCDWEAQGLSLIHI